MDGQANHILHNPASDLELPRLELRLPKHVLTIKEAETVLAEPDLDTATGGGDGTRLLSNLGEAFTPNRLAQLVRDHVNAARLGKTAPATCFGTRRRP